MRILFDHQAFDMQTHGGVSRCFYELKKHLPVDFHPTISVKETNNVYLQADGIKPFGSKYDSFIKRGYFPFKGRLFTLYNYLFDKSYWNNEKNKFLAIEMLKSQKFDCFHPTFFDDYFLQYLGNKPFVLTIHDMIPELFPDYFSCDNYQIIKKKKLAPIADAIIAPSENTKNDIIKLLNIPEEKIHVIHHGFNNLKLSDDQPIYDNYFLYVGSRYNYKNFKKLIISIEPFLKDYPNVKLVCTGQPFKEDEITLFKTLDIQPSIIHHFAYNDDVLCNLYKNSIAFIYPSEYEGFGIPILEAYSCQCPVLLNKKSCFPEIAGNSSLFFRFEDNDLIEKMEYLLHISQESRQEIITKQKERLNLYSWEKAAFKLSQVYKKIANS